MKRLLLVIISVILCFSLSFAVYADEEDEIISKVSVSDIDMPEIGCEPDTSGSVPDDADYEIDEILWFFSPVSEYTSMTKMGIDEESQKTFTAGSTYMLVVVLKSDDGYCFDNSTLGMINGENASIANDDDTLYVSLRNIGPLEESDAQVHASIFDDSENISDTEKSESTDIVKSSISDKSGEKTSTNETDSATVGEVSEEQNHFPWWILIVGSAVVVAVLLYVYVIAQKKKK